MYDMLADIIKYAFVVVVYIFIYSVVKLVYLDISDTRRMNKDDDEGLGYLKLINLRSDLTCKVIESYPLHEDNIVGRSRKCDIHINDPYLSKEHAEIYMEKGKYYIQDLGSTNGTYVNKNKLSSQPVKLKDNDKIIFGDIRFIFVTKD